MPQSPQERPYSIDPEQSRGKKGLIIVHTGDGKGKSTAAFGTAMRAVGSGMKVCIVQFIKGKWHCGEHEAAKRLAPDIEIHQMGEGFTWDTKDRERDTEVARRAWEFGKEKLSSGKYGLVVFDEINYVMDFHYLGVNEVAETLRKKPPLVHVILTGRNAPLEIIEIADLVTEMKEIKHPFQKGILAERGIDF